MSNMREMREFEAEQILQQYKIHSYKEVKEACGVILLSFKPPRPELSKVVDVIIMEELNTKDRTAEMVLKKHWLKCYVVDNYPELTIEKAMRLFNQDHSSYYNSRKVHDQLTRDFNVQYLHVAVEMSKLLGI